MATPRPAVLLLLLAAAAGAAGAADQLLATTAEGQLRGSQLATFWGTAVRAFRGVPYAEPPTGSLRFRPPRPRAPWTGLRDATAEAPACPQMELLTKEYSGEEDCLYLNVYARYNATADPVLVWFHGGAFVEGSGGARWGGPAYLLEQKLVLVTFNYRLGPLGFLSTGNRHIPGNYGLKDAVAALGWVRRNIAAFGGDPARVTVYGYSAGAAAAHMLTLSPLAKGLLDAVAFGSGSGLHSWALFDRPAEAAAQLAAFLSCPRADAPLLACLRNLSAEQIVRTYYRFPALVGDMPMPYGPVVEADPSQAADDPPFLPAPPAQLLAEGRVLPVPALTGLTSAEGVDAAWPIHQSPAAADAFDGNFSALMQAFSPVTGLSEAQANEVRRLYFGSAPLREAPLENLTALFTDMFFTVDSVGGSVRHAAAAAGAPVYFYRFSFEGRISELVRSGLAAEPHGPMHADDLLYLMGRQYPDPPAGWPNATESALIRRLTAIWSSFAATGDPAAASGLVWKPLAGPGDGFSFVDIGPEFVTTHGPPAPDRVALWERLAQEAGGSGHAGPSPTQTQRPAQRAPEKAQGAAAPALSAAGPLALLGAALAAALAAARAPAPRP